MYFPSDVIIEAAFSNDINESDYAQSGYTEITSFVRRITGTLRGRQFEIGQAEAGTLQVTLDNSDRRFTLGTTASPYAPNVKPGRRFRIRGKNMVHPNVARSGTRDNSTLGFLFPVDRQAYASELGGYAVDLPTESYTYGEQGKDLDRYINMFVTSGVSGENILAQWYVPLEYGVRLTHSAYIWKVSGTAPAGSTLRLEIRYFDSADQEVVDDLGVPVARPMVSSNMPTVPTRVAVAHAPVGTAKYALMTYYVHYNGAPSGNQNYGIAAIQSEVPANLAPDISGAQDVIQWQMQGSGTVAKYVGSEPAAEVTWAAGDVSAFITIPRLIPGETYAVAAEIKKNTGPNLLMSIDDGQTTVSVSSTTYQPATLVFVAERPEMDLAFFAATSPLAGESFRIRRLNVQKSTVAISPASSPTETGETAWQRPYDIFEGWTEHWSVSMRNTNEVTVPVVDRTKKLGEVLLGHPYKEVVTNLIPDLWLPLDEDSAQTDGVFAQLGEWGGDEFTSLAIAEGQSGAGAGTYNSTENANPVGDLGLHLRPSSGLGWLFRVSRDNGGYVPPSGPIISIRPKPKPPSQTKRRYRYTKTYPAIWSRSYEGGGSTRSGDPDTMYHGYYDSFNGNQKSMIGFNYAAIQRDLIGATIIKTELTLKGQHAGQNSGIASLKIGTHNASSKPSTFSGTTGKWTGKLGEQEQKTFGLGVTPGQQLKAGTIKGFVIGPASNTSAANYGYLRGATQSGKPYLTITYEVWK